MKDDIAATVSTLRSRYGIGEPRIGIILGSGLSGIVDQMEGGRRVPFSAIPGLPLPTVQGHQGELVWGRLEGAELLALSGRIHFYEGCSMARITLPVRVMAGLGVEILILTNAGRGGEQ